MNAGGSRIVQGLTKASEVKLAKAWEKPCEVGPTSNKGPWCNGLRCLSLGKDRMVVCAKGEHDFTGMLSTLPMTCRR